MTSRFVSGANEERSQEWLTVQATIEAKKVAKTVQGQQEGGKSLYETLQANKAAKQDAFEESVRLKNQFRALDEDEVEFLESLNERARLQEREIRMETLEHLNTFREQQSRSDKAISTRPDVVTEPAAESWTVSKKRKRQKPHVVPGPRSRIPRGARDESPDPGSRTVKRSEEDEQASAHRAADSTLDMELSKKTVDLKGPCDKGEASKPVPALGLAVYSSDED